MTHPLRHRRRYLVLAAAAAALLLIPAVSAFAHGFTSVVYVDATSPERDHVRTTLGLEYDLLVVSAADAQKDDALFKAGTAAFDNQDPAEQAAALEAHADTVMAYVTKRFGVTVEGDACAPKRVGGFKMTQRDGVPYAQLVLDHRCPEAGESHDLRSALFPGSEEFVRGTKTIVTYDLDLQTGSASLDAKHPSFSTHQSRWEQYWEFFRLGAEHLYTGIDHILFLLALIAGSRRLREIVLAATTFTLAHSVTFILAALGLVHAPASIVEPVIALSIAVVAAMHLWRLWQRGSHATDLDTTSNGHFGLDRAGWARLAMVFLFGLVHGLGFASALGIDRAFSWTLLSSLFVFNLGIESVQLAIILAVFPLLALLRRRAPLAGLSATGAIAAGVCAMGLVWFAQRAFLT
ncbi:HupE/UreJ family protein [Solirubrobacter ginsenosidimutans]|uniref:HupE/UreJ family protein n=1 Tax=Solirubrobacter ginsenosidimutans TaxID=490573 RepID=A0A9X3RY11_9ACTN|nr:HupE/UreJ family protein [Solirubrobacter ginsenosidimutans]MDA0159150.1 HupE/UreJ family protein [Solirubrobacter ginsenosidimutans]